MTWTQAASTFTTTAQGLNFVLEPTEWSLWSLEQAKETARHIASMKASGVHSWAPGSTVKLFYREPAKKP